MKGKIINLLKYCKINIIADVTINNYKTILVWTLLIMMLFIVLIKIIFPFIGEDAGFYLKNSVELRRGQNYYEMANSYNPLGMYILTIPFYFNTDISFALLFLYFYCFMFINVWLYMKILILFKIVKSDILLYAGLFIVTLLLLDGTSILLETFVLLFALLSLLFLYKYRSSGRFTYLVLSGAFAFLSFFSKQFGAFIIPAAVAYLILVRKDIKNLFISLFGYFSGLIITLITIISYFNLFEKTNVKVLITRLAGFKIIGGEKTVTGVGYSLSIAVHSFLDFILKYPYFLILPLFLLYAKKVKYNSEIIMLILIFLTSLVQFLFASYGHYFQLSVMPLLILIPILFNNIFDRKSIMNKIFLALVTIFILFGFYRIYNILIFNKTNYFELKRDYAVISKKIKPETKVYLKSVSQSFYFIAKLRSLNLKTIGYSFPNLHNFNNIIKCADSGSSFVVRNELYESQLKNDMRLIKTDEMNLSNGIHSIILKK